MCPALLRFGYDACPLKGRPTFLKLIEINATKDLDNVDRIAVEIWDLLVGQTRAAFFDSLAGHMGSIHLFEAFSRKL